MRAALPKRHAACWCTDMPVAQVAVDVSQVDRSHIFRTMGTAEDSPSADEMGELYDQMLTEAAQLIVPFAAYEIVDNTLDEPALAEYPQVLMGMCTIGEAISTRVRALFAEGAYPEAMLLDHISDACVGATDRALCAHVLEVLRQRGIGCSRRVSPGENAPLALQRDIHTALSAKQTIPMQVRESCMMDPVKSQSFLLGCRHDPQAAPDMKHIGHDCTHCKLKNCPWRKPS